MDRVIPPFYACYLLRSTIRHQNLYVGSTPHPVRRLKQHNGLAKGGAVRTSRDSLRPWEMTCLVTGFPSKIAALQFEWAWQNTHLTRHIAIDERITQTQQKTRISPKTGRTRRRTGRPRMSLTDKLANLHILLRAKSFERWPLEVRFFAPDVYKFWERTIAKTSDTLRSGIKTVMDQSVLDQETRSGDDERPVGIYALDVTYLPMKSVLEKSRALLMNQTHTCAICQQVLAPVDSMVLICHAEGCKSVSHMKCLSKHFLEAEKQPVSLLPTHGNCPMCKTPLLWTDLVRDLSLRTRGEKESAALFKERRSRRKAGTGTTAESVMVDEDQSESDLTDMSEADFDPTSLMFSVGYQEVDESQPLEDEDESQSLGDADNALVGRPAAAIKTTTSGGRQQRRSERVIEDSDWDEAEVIE